MLAISITAGCGMEVKAEIRKVLKSFEKDIEYVSIKNLEDLYDKRLS